MSEKTLTETKGSETMGERTYYPWKPGTRSDILLSDESEGLVVIRVNGYTNHLCGYVDFAKSEIPSAWHGQYSADALQYLAIHGGLTYAETVGDRAVFGFDCAHSGDDEQHDLRDPEFVMKLTRQMKQQLLDYAAVIDEWRAVGRERRAEMMQAIVDKAEHHSRPGFGAMIGYLSGMREFGDSEPTP